jgi:hypothetical protein
VNAKKPPPIPRPRQYVREIRVGGNPQLTPETSAKLAALNSGVVREIQATFPPPRGKELWGAPDVSALLIMIGAQLERAAKYGKLEAYEEQIRRGRLEKQPAATSKDDPAYDSEATTKPFRRPDLGDE